MTWTRLRSSKRADIIATFISSVALNPSTADELVKLAPLGAGVWLCLELACVPRNDLTSYSTSALGEPDAPALGTAATSVPQGPQGGGGADPGATGQVAPSGGSSGGSLSDEPDIDDADATPGGDITPDGDTPRGSIVRSVPSDGALGVPADAQLLIDFGRSMDTATVPNAFQTDDILMAGAVFAWSEADSVVQITLPQPLELASGADPRQVPAACYSYRVSDAALDASGQPIEPGSVTFCTSRRINQSLSPVLDRDTSGNFRSDGNYGDGTCARVANAICVGDSGFIANAEYRGFATFDSSSLPASFEVLAAELRVDITATVGNPLAELGDLLIEQVRFAVIGPDPFANTEAVTVSHLLPVSGAASTLSAGVEAAMRAPGDGRTQFRLRFAAGTDQDGVSDHIVASPDTLELQVDYLTP
jgi:hypothetical protein